MNISMSYYVKRVVGRVVEGGSKARNPDVCDAIKICK
jgi:hypothetical protein